MNVSLVNETIVPDLKELYWPYFRYFLPPYIIISAIAFFGNILSIIVISNNRNLQTPTFSLLLSLAVYDLIFTIIAPVHVHWLFLPGRWFLGDIGCRIYYFLMRLHYAYSVLILVATAVLRFLAIYFPVKFRQKKIRAWKIVILLTLVSAACCAPLLHAHRTITWGQYVYCGPFNWVIETQMQYYYTMQTILYVFPLTTLIVLYSAISIKLRFKSPIDRNKDCSFRETSAGTQKRRSHYGSQRTAREASRRRIAYMLMALVLGFFLCWTPYVSMEFYLLWWGHASNTFWVVFRFAMLPVFANASLNMPIYCFMAQEFRHCLKALLHKVTG